jgi:tetratricopeptide (TPR) repeat protein
MLTGDYRPAAASLRQAAEIFGDIRDRAGEAHSINNLGSVQQRAGDYPAAAASKQQALAIFRDIGDRLGQANALNDLGLTQQLTGDYPAAAASYHQALASTATPVTPSARPIRSAISARCNS